ncbi:MAG: S-adenosylmethionine decarboxylase [Methanomicrobiales archaeon]|nr:S-adenosylmethionine decarboxylase [Methanomicrobiales archaeon]
MLEAVQEMSVGSIPDEDIIRKFKRENAWGLCTSVDLRDCDPATIRDPEQLRRFIIDLCDLIDMHRFGEPTIIHFGPNDKVAGYSMTQLIETSLISGHFANATSAAYLDIFSCKEYGPKKTAEFCRAFFGARSMTYTAVLRY